MGWLCSGRRYFPHYSYCRNPRGREFSVPARTLKSVKLLTSHSEGVRSSFTTIVSTRKQTSNKSVDQRFFGKCLCTGCGEVGVEVDVVRGWAFMFGRGWACRC